VETVNSVLRLSRFTDSVNFGCGDQVVVILYSCNIRCSSLTADLQIQQARFPVDLEIFDERKLGVLKTGGLRCHFTILWR
jgi:hypothetical protein